MSNKKIKPCPFCGGETKIEKRWEYGYGIVCISCGAKSPDFQTETNAIKSWNDYANDLLKMEQIEPEISLDGIHPDLINGVIEAKTNYPKLKPCPFCNGKAILEESKFGFNHISCESCGARITAFYMGDLIKAWNRRVDVANTNKSCEKSCREENATFEPLVPKWVPHFGGGESLDVSISQYKKLRFRIYDTDGSSNFKYHCDCTVINFIGDKDSCIFEEVGEFDTLEEAKTKANECIKELGERLVYFSNNIKTEKDK